MNNIPDISDMIAFYVSVLNSMYVDTVLAFYLQKFYCAYSN